MQPQLVCLLVCLHDLMNLLLDLLHPLLQLLQSRVLRWDCHNLFLTFSVFWAFYDRIHRLQVLLELREKMLNLCLHLLSGSGSDLLLELSDKCVRLREDWWYCHNTFI